MRLIPTRRRILQLAPFALMLCTRPSFAASLHGRLTRNSGCGCCLAWADLMKVEGMTLEIVDSDDLDAVKAKLGVPEDLYGCHTTEIGDYVLEGHVPLPAVKRLLAEKPDAVGLSVPGMPMGSPGMGGTPEDYDVVLFGRAAGRTVYGRYRESTAI